MEQSGTELVDGRKQLRVAVIGAGIVGLLTALEVQRSGHKVILIEPGEAGGSQSASYGNGAWLNPGALMPISVPGLWKKVPGFLLDRNGPFVIRWRHLPALLPWLWRFVMAGRTWAQIATCAEHRFELCRDTVVDHARWAEEAGVGNLVRRTGLMFVYHSREDFLRETREWNLRRRFGVAFTELDDAALREAEPDLGSEYRFGAMLDHGAHLSDTRSYCAALCSLSIRRGAEWIQDRATGFVIENGRLVGVRVGARSIPCDRAVIAAGAWSGSLAKMAGDSVPMVSERGYHVVIPHPAPMPQRALMPYDGKMAVTPTADGLRIAGQVELASLSAKPDWRRADILLRFAKRMFPDFADGIEAGSVAKWMGHRPSTPDGLPSIGKASGCADIVHAFGHGHSGMCQAPATARLVAALLDNGSLPFNPRPYAPQRFR
jgi:D-amino-acid dehydrogenase